MRRILALILVHGWRSFRLQDSLVQNGFLSNQQAVLDRLGVPVERLIPLF